MRAQEEPENLYARSAVLMDADTGRILYEKNGEEVLPMASTTKIMTLLVTLEKCGSGRNGNRIVLRGFHARLCSLTSGKGNGTD